MNSVQVRHLRPSDSLDELTALLHRAFGPLDRLGLPCGCVNQPVEVTRQRAKRGECYVALDGDRLVGTMTLERPDSSNDCATYRRPRVASLHQFAIDPVAQGQGFGEAMLQFAQGRARELGYCTLALDTPSRASHLLSFYQSQGFRPIAEFRKPGRPYQSTVLCKSLGTPRQPLSPWFSPHRSFSLDVFRVAARANRCHRSRQLDRKQGVPANSAHDGTLSAPVLY